MVRGGLFCRDGPIRSQTAETAPFRQQLATSLRALSNSGTGQLELGLEDPIRFKEKLMKTTCGRAGGREGTSREGRPGLSVMKTWRPGMESGKRQ